MTAIGSVRIEAADRAGRERWLRYCARPPLALDRLRELDPARLVYDPPKRGLGGSGPLRLTPLELLDRLAALVPPPRIHRHRYFGVLAPNSPLRPAVTALALAATTSPPAANAEPTAESADRRAARQGLPALWRDAALVFCGIAAPLGQSGPVASAPDRLDAAWSQRGLRVGIDTPPAHHFICTFVRFALRLFPRGAQEAVALGSKNDLRIQPPGLATPLIEPGKRSPWV